MEANKGATLKTILSYVLVAALAAAVTYFVMEGTRERSKLDELRSLCMTDLDGAMHMALRMSLEHVRAQGKTLHPDTLAALNAYEPQPEG